MNILALQKLVNQILKPEIFFFFLFPILLPLSFPLSKAQYLSQAFFSGPHHKALCLPPIELAK